jgi:DNA repair protein RadD
VTIRQDGMYRKLLSHLDAQYVGFTATHFRLGHGYIHIGEGRLFNHIAYDMSKPDIFNKLVSEGYLTRLITKATVMKMNDDGIRIRAKDYAVNDLSAKFDRESITNVAVEEIIEYGNNYKKWLIFAIDIDHAEHITQALCKRGIAAAVVHSKMDADRDEVVQGFRDGKYRTVVNVDILTMGLNVPDIDMIAILRLTRSPVIHVQTIGRGLRVTPEKTHCLVLDFAGNTARLGPINDVIVKQKRKGSGTGQQIVKECPGCMALHHPSVRVCDVCGHVFVFKSNLSVTAGTHEVVRTVIAKWHTLDNISFNIHNKEGKPASMRVTYRIGLQTFSEWICYDHEGFAKYKADNWVRFRSPDGMPTPQDVYQLCEWAPWMKRPREVLVNFSERFPQIKDIRF